MNTIIKAAPSGGSPFDSIRKLGETGQEYWLARELMSILGYTKWQNFGKNIKKAIRSCENVGNPVSKHFLLRSVSLRGQSAEDYQLSR
ncbi:MAG: BRO family protein, partial [Chroococcidiopsis sp.]